MSNELNCCKCGAAVPDDASNCPDCGAKLSLYRGLLRSDILPALAISVLVFIIDSIVFHPGTLVFIGLYLIFRPLFILFSSWLALGLTVVVFIVMLVAGGKPPFAYFYLILLVFVIVRLMFLAYKKSFSRAQVKVLARFSVYVLLFAAIFGLFQVNKSVARARAETLIAACESYNHEHGKYPDTLEDLVPEYIDEVPHTMYTLGSGRFIYRNTDRVTYLMYVLIQPLGRPYYDFDSHEWRYMD